jgi:TRAP-type transport system large permease protein
MTIAVFTLSLLGAMALGMPIAFALIVCGVALMYQLDIFDSQIVAQNIINGADSFPLMAVPFFMLAGEIMNTGGLSRRIVNVRSPLSDISRVASAMSPSWPRASCPPCRAPR